MSAVFEGVRIVGAGQSAYAKRSPDTIQQLLYTAGSAALRDAGLDWRQVDALAVTSFQMPPDNVTTFAEHVGVQARFLFQGLYGGASGIAGMAQAARAIRGELKKLRYEGYLGDRQPEIFVVSNIMKGDQYIGAHDAGMFWHSDGPFLRTPHGPSALRALEVPMQDGRALGDTHFANTAASYGQAKDQEQQAMHPVVRLHSVTGRKCLYVTRDAEETLRPRARCAGTQGSPRSCRCSGWSRSRPRRPRSATCCETNWRSGARW